MLEHVGQNSDMVYALLSPTLPKTRSSDGVTQGKKKEIESFKHDWLQTWYGRVGDNDDHVTSPFLTKNPSFF